MNIPAIVLLICLGLAATAAAQPTSSGGAAGPGGAPKGQLSEVRALVQELQARTEKLSELMELYRALIEKRPQSEGGSPEQKQADEERLAKWTSALERLLARVQEAHANVVEGKQALEKAATGQLPTGIAKDVANARNQADAQRADAEQALAKKPKPARVSKKKQAPANEKTPPPIPDDL